MQLDNYQQNYWIFAPQSISPGLTRTEFYGRMHKLEDIEKSKQEYDKHCKDVSGLAGRGERLHIPDFEWWS